MKLVISGATGFVGSHMVRYFSKRGHDVLALGRSLPPRALEKYAEYKLWDAVNSPMISLSQADIFIHCGGHVDFRGKESDILRQNVEGTRRTLEISRKAALFVYVSSASVYGLSNAVKMANEDTVYPWQFPNVYAKSKALAEQEVLKKRKSIILRPHAIYGPGDRTLLRKLLSSSRFGMLPMLGDGQNLVSVTHVGNLCAAIDGLQKKNAKGIFNVCDLNPMRMESIYAGLVREFGLKGSVNIPLGVGKILVAVMERLGVGDLTRDTLKQLTENSTIDNGKLVSCGVRPVFTYQQGMREARKWVDSLGGMAQYLSNNSPSWDGKLISF